MVVRRLLRRAPPTDARLKIDWMRVGIIDVGANTARLLVASADGEEPSRGEEDRVQLGLGREIEQSGRISDAKLAEAVEVATAHVRRARSLGCVAVETIVTSPGRQAENGAELVSSLAAATSVPTRVLTSEEEAVLSWRGVVSGADDLRDPIAVCDVGGGSAQITIGNLETGPSWVRSLDIGSLRLVDRAFEHDPPNAEDLVRAQRAIADAFEDLAPPLPRTALAVGGTARGLRKIVGDELTEETLGSAVQLFSEKSSAQLAKRFGLEESRARTMTAGVLILFEMQRRLNVGLRVARGGVRQGAALALLAELGVEARSA